MAPPQGGPDNQITGYELVYRRADDTEEVIIGSCKDCFGRVIKFMDDWMDDKRIKDEYMNGCLDGQTEDQLLSILKANYI